MFRTVRMGHETEACTRLRDCLLCTGANEKTANDRGANAREKEWMGVRDNSVWMFGAVIVGRRASCMRVRRRTISLFRCFVV